MATATYVPLATTTVSGSPTSITFSSIPSGYTDLRLVFTGIANGTPRVQLNGDTGSNYSTTNLYGDGANPYSSSGVGTSATYMYLNHNFGAPGTTYPQMFTLDLFSYTNTSIYKTTLSSGADDRNGSGGSGGIVGLWRSTAAITSMYIYFGGITIGTGATATLWGI